MTERELEREWTYRYEERLGILMDGREGSCTVGEAKLARADADEAVARLKAESST